MRRESISIFACVAVSNVCWDGGEGGLEHTVQTAFASVVIHHHTRICINKFSCSLGREYFQGIDTWNDNIDACIRCLDASDANEYNSLVFGGRSVANGQAATKGRRGVQEHRSIAHEAREFSRSGRGGGARR